MSLRPDSQTLASAPAVPVLMYHWVHPDPGHHLRLYGVTPAAFAWQMNHLKSAGFRRLCVNACYWALGMAEQITADGCVDIVGEYDPNDIGVGGHKPGLKPADYALD